MEECLRYFRQAISKPLSVPPWSEWWAENEALVQRVFPLMEYVRLKHRRLRGAREILQRTGELPADYVPQSPLITQSCGDCGERTMIAPSGPGSGSVNCSICGPLGTYDCDPPPESVI
jgi:hypothetical protein